MAKIRWSNVFGVSVVSISFQFHFLLCFWKSISFCNSLLMLLGECACALITYPTYMYRLFILTFGSVPSKLNCNLNSTVKNWPILYPSVLSFFSLTQKMCVSSRFCLDSKHVITLVEQGRYRASVTKPLCVGVRVKRTVCNRLGTRCGLVFV